MLGKKDLRATEFPTIDTATWPTFLTFADKYIKVKR